MALKALIVDDHQASANMLMWAMQAAGYEARIALSGAQAIVSLDTYIPDVVLLDINMPYMDGYELCEKLREDVRLENSLFLAQTGWSSEDRKKLSRAAGFHHHVVKPVDVEILLGIIQREFKSARAR